MIPTQPATDPRTSLEASLTQALIVGALLMVGMVAVAIQAWVK